MGGGSTGPQGQTLQSEMGVYPDPTPLICKPQAQILDPKS